MGATVDPKCKHIIAIDRMTTATDSESNLGVSIRFFYGEARFFA